MLTRIAVLAALAASVGAPSASARVLRVGTYHGVRGQYASIQAAVDAARPGDWVLVAPGDYHERADQRAHRGPQPSDAPAGVVIHTPRLHLRGLSRDGVVVDGTKPGSERCSARRSSQDLGPHGLGRNGILVWKADGVSVDNLTVCNFLGGKGSAGNEIWFNGGDGTGRIGLGAFEGSYLNATSTFFSTERTAATYGLFSSNARGPGTWTHTYASNFNDAAYYVGACRRVCNQTVDDARGEYSALGYSGTNSGGSILIENSEFDRNQDGFDTDSENNDDAPSPQDGACSNDASRSCWMFIHNYVHDNNSADVPRFGTAAHSPIGTGMTITGGRNDTVMDNRFEDNGAWGLLVLPFPDTRKPPKVAHCVGGVHMTGLGCLYDDWGIHVAGNTFRHDGYYGNETNGDLGEVTLTGPHPTNCFSGNTDASGTLTTSPAGLQDSKPTCGPDAQADPNAPLVSQAVCATGLLGGTCPKGAHYPRKRRPVMRPLPHGLESMPDPCKGVPANPWCPGAR